MTDIILETLCGCTKRVRGDIFSREYRVALPTKVPMMTNYIPDREVCKYRLFKYTFQTTGDGLRIFKEVLDD
jgi:hypothetical protein